MTFTSFEFLLYFPLVVLLYNIIPKKVRVVYLLAVSYGFYALMQPVYVLLLALVTLLTYFFARKIASTENEKSKKTLFVSSIVFVLLPLFFFKYFNFVNESFTALLSAIGISVEIATIKFMLPVGISFYTFMSLGYLIDVYNEEVEAEKNICSLGVFLSFFPIILSGPIERAGNMLPQIKDLKSSTPNDLVRGAKLMLWGYFMKLCVADRLGIYIDAVFNNATQHNGSSLAFASILYPFQVYADLGGYSLIAIGVARCMGIAIIPNFRRPFFSTSLSELWRRWHISLIQWLTDYIYTPLSFAFRSKGVAGIVVALMITFLISGIWHGATLTFVVWGLIQGIYLSVEALLQKKRTNFEAKYSLTKRPWYIFLCSLVVFVLFAFSQIFGKCTSFSEASMVIGKILGEHGEVFFDKTTLVYGLFCLAILFFVDLRDEFFPRYCKMIESKYVVIRWASYLLLLLLVISFGVLDSGQFIYFQF